VLRRHAEPGHGVRPSARRQPSAPQNERVTPVAVAASMKDSSSRPAIAALQGGRLGRVLPAFAVKMTPHGNVGVRSKPVGIEGFGLNTSSSPNDLECNNTPTLCIGTSLTSGIRRPAGRFVAALRNYVVCNIERPDKDQTTSASAPLVRNSSIFETK
jgi:hypothetical protein